MGAIGTKSAATVANDCTHSISAVSISLSVQAAAGGWSVVDRSAGLGFKEVPHVPVSQPLTGSSHPVAEDGHNGNVRTTSKPKPQTATIDTTVDKRELTA
jgi:hypothetical protein